MLQFIRIIFLNFWRGMRRANILPALTLMLASLGVLLVGSNAAASTSPRADVLVPIQPMQVHRTARQLAFVSPKRSASLGVRHQVTHSKPKPQTNNDTFAGQPSLSEGSASSPAIVSPSAAVQLTPGPASCQQGQTIYTITSALVTLPSAATDAGTITWYWETRVDSGTDSPATPPIANMSSSSSQQVDAGQTQVTLTGDQSQPLLGAPASTTYAYSVRLHAVYNMSDFVSSWIGIPQDSGVCAQAQ